MKYYKDNENTTYVYPDDGSQDHLIGHDQILITKEEADVINELSYDLKRKAEYPDFTEYLDGIVKGDQAQIDKYIADCQAVKLKYPKGSE